MAALVVAVLGASSDVTVTWLELAGPNDPAELPWPVTLTMFFTVAFSPWVTVKVHDPGLPDTLPPGMSSAVQVVFAAGMLPVVGQAGPLNGEPALKTVPYTLSQIWSMMMSPKFELLVMLTV